MMIYFSSTQHDGNSQFHDQNRTNVQERIGSVEKDHLRI